MNRVLHFIIAAVMVISIASCKSSQKEIIEVDYTTSRGVVESFMMSITHGQFKTAAECCVYPSSLLSISDQIETARLTKTFEQNFSSAQTYRFIKVDRSADGFDYTYVIDSGNIFTISTHYNGKHWLISKY